MLVVRRKLGVPNYRMCECLQVDPCRCWSDGQALSCRADSWVIKGWRGGETEISNQLALSYWKTVRLGLLSGFGSFSSLCKGEPARWVAILIPAPLFPGWVPSPRKEPMFLLTSSCDLSSYLSDLIAWRQQKVRWGNGRWSGSWNWQRWSDWNILFQLLHMWDLGWFSYV